jgi:hypothetical protein
MVCEIHKGERWLAFAASIPLPKDLSMKRHPQLPPFPPFYMEIPEPPPLPVLPPEPLCLYGIPEPPPRPVPPPEPVWLYGIPEPPPRPVPPPEPLWLYGIPEPPPLKPGTPAPYSAQYREIGPSGEVGREVTSVRGKTLPPTTRPNSSYWPVDRTDNKSGRGW